MNVLIKQFKEKGLAPQTTVSTQPSRRFPKHEKSLIFGILAKKDHMKIFWKPEYLEMAESDIFCVESHEIEESRKLIG